MRVKFWGTRGSVPSPIGASQIKAKIRAALLRATAERLENEADVDQFIARNLPFSLSGTYGGNTSCVEILSGDSRLVCDMGSGLRELGNQAMAEWDGEEPLSFDILMSHVHWDHIMGFPFFPPAYVPGAKIRVHGGHDFVERAMRQQHSAPCFPVDFDALGADISFHVLEVGSPVAIGGFRVTPKKQIHHADSYGFRIESENRCMVYSTDSEHQEGSAEEAEAFAAFFRGADLVVFDAMYSLADAITDRHDWGHSSNVVGVDLCIMAGAKRLCLFHHEPRNDDETLQQILEQTVRYANLSETSIPLEVVSAYDGMTLDL